MNIISKNTRIQKSLKKKMLGGETKPNKKNKTLRKLIGDNKKNILGTAVVLGTAGIGYAGLRRLRGSRTVKDPPEDQEEVVETADAKKAEEAEKAADAKKVEEKLAREAKAKKEKQRQLNYSTGSLMGEPVLIINLESKVGKTLNGLVGRAIDFDSQKSRYTVKLKNREVSFFWKNLVKATEKDLYYSNLESNAVKREGASEGGGKNIKKVN
jgi:hypothetical protein